MINILKLKFKSSFVINTKMLRIISWNVLYRTYEETYKPNSKILLSSEKDRVERIVQLLGNYVNSNTVVCLQEVSTEIILALTDKFKLLHRVFSLNIRDDEHLVTIVPKNYRVLCADFHATANGYLGVTDDTNTIINCHLIPQRCASEDVLEKLKLFRTNNNPVYIAGDFNERHKIVEIKLGNDFVCPKYGNTYKKRGIDHIIFDKNYPVLYKPQKIIQKLISDHHMIMLDISS